MIRKSILTIILTSISALMSVAVCPVAPPFLRPGDKIAVISPSSTPGKNVPGNGAAVLEQWGFTPVMGEHVLSEHRSFAGTHNQRLEDLLRALRDPEIKAIMCTRGGYGAANVLALMHPDTLKRYPKWIIGYSDITAYLSAEVSAGNMGIHANMCGRLSKTQGTDKASLTLRDMLMGIMPHYDFPGHALNHEGQARGILVGGNLSVFTDIAGSPYDFLNDDFLAQNDVILFIEDVGENFAKLDRMFHQLVLRGALSKIKALVVGRFDDCPPSRGYNDVFEMINEYVAPYGIPICYDFPTGHDEDHNYPLIEGCMVSLNITKSGVTMDFFPVH